MGEYTQDQDQPNMDLPDAKSPSLHLTHPTPEERRATWTLNSVSWGSALSKEDYLEREAYLMTVPLAKNGGVTHWILVERSLPPNNRPILGSCESLRKRALVSRDGVVIEVITHGIGSVFTNPAYRGRGYASRMLRELGVKLNHWQTDKCMPGMENCNFSILYSDIGKKYYAHHGWHPFPSSHIAFPPAPVPTTMSIPAKRLANPDIPDLCTLDENYIRRDLANAKDGKTHVALVPDHDTMQWHHLREDFLTSKIFAKSPKTKGAIAGELGNRIWAIWTRSFYGPLVPESGNVLHILRLVLEDDTASDENAAKLKSILQIAQEEALDWKLDDVEIWNPTPVVKSLIQKTGLKHKEEDRQQESIASLMWYGEGSGKMDEIEWVGNEKFGWC
jgi:GNAT superfamily N-acetyltransferase